MKWREHGDGQWSSSTVQASMYSSKVLASAAQFNSVAIKASVQNAMECKQKESQWLLLFHKCLLTNNTKCFQQHLIRDQTNILQPSIRFAAINTGKKQRLQKSLPFLRRAEIRTLTYKDKRHPASSSPWENSVRQRGPQKASTCLRQEQMCHINHLY